MPDFEWTEARENAAQLIAEGRLSVGEIAAKLDIPSRTLYEWRRNPDFSGRVDAIVEEVRTALTRRAVAMAEQRVARLNRDWFRLQQVIDERAADPTMADVPGGTTGLVVRTVKKIGSGEDSEIVYEYRVDDGTLAELRQIEKQAAQELGQWTERSVVEDARKSYETANSPESL